MPLIRCRGAVALEFLFLFPFVVGILYASATYGVIFYSKYEMQRVVDQATNAALRVDRSAVTSDDVTSTVVSAASNALDELWAQTSEKLRTGIEEYGCSQTVSNGVTMVSCSVVRNNAEAPLVPQLRFGYLGKFPPMPENLGVSASIAF